VQVASLEFLLLLMALSAAFCVLPGRAARQGLFALVGAGVLALLIADLLTLTVLAAFLLSGHACGLLLRKRPNSWVLGVYLALLLAAFVYLKKYDFLRLLIGDDLLRHGVQIVGLSYMLFRQIHFLVDVRQGQIRRWTLWSYLNYQLNFLGLLAGPIQRYPEFQEFWDDPQPRLADRHELLRTYLRIFVGVIKISFIGALFLAKYDDLVLKFDAGGGSWSRAVRILYFYPAYIYFNFSGYCDIVIGGAALLGLKMPENFDHPYLSRNIIDFWTRWHRSLGFWIRDYIFTPLYKSIAQRSPSAAPSLAFVCYFVALFLAGMWHGSTWNFTVFALVHGTAVSANKLWEMAIVHRRGRPGYRQYMASRPVRIAASVVTFHFLCASFLFVPTDLGRTMRILGTLVGVAT